VSTGHDRVGVHRVSLIDLLSCVVVEPRLGGVLFLDADAGAVLSIAEALTVVLSAARRRPHRTLVLDASFDDESLWSGWALAKRDSAITVVPRPGALVETPEGAIPVVVVPDVAVASIVTRTAAMVAAGADVVHVERAGQGLRWAPEACWLAAGRSDDLLSISPHLLDRFPVRWTGRLPRDRTADLVKALEPALKAASTAPFFSADALEMVAQIQSGPDALPPFVQAGDRERPIRPAGMRRYLVAGRAARAICGLRGGTEVRPSDVGAALELLGLKSASGAAPQPEDAEDRDEPLKIPAAAGSPDLTAHPAATPQAAQPRAIRVQVSQPVGTAAERATLEQPRYPEDDPRALSEPQSLRDFGHPRRSGHVVGARVGGYTAASDLRDLAIVPTFLRAALRRLLPLSDGRPRPLQIFPEDLRCARRGSRPDAALVLVLDHTVRGGDWHAALAGQIQWAYQGRAAVTVIEFGHADMRDELRPERYRCTTVVDPRIEAIFNRAPGRATPLAAAIDLAAEELSRMRLRTHPPFREIRLVLATDGRGNVPFEAMPPGQIVRREGIDDALDRARGSRIFRDVQTIVVAPRLYQHAELPGELAAALGGQVATIAPVLPEGGP
jgi:magnesium chelatase subunit D